MKLSHLLIALSLLNIGYAAKAKYTLKHVSLGSLYRGKALSYFTCQRSQKDKRSESFVDCGKQQKQTVEHQNLSGKQMKGLLANLSEFSDVNFDNSDLSFALMSNATFIDSKFNEAQMPGVYLEKTTMIGVDMNSANLCGSFLIGADLSKVENLQSAKLTGALFSKDTKLPFSKAWAKKLGMVFVKSKAKAIEKFTYRHISESCEDELTRRDVAALE